MEYLIRPSLSIEDRINITIALNMYMGKFQQESIECRKLGLDQMAEDLEQIVNSIRTTLQKMDDAEIVAVDSSGGEEDGQHARESSVGTSDV